MISMDKKYQTRDGQAVRVICADRKCGAPVVALIGENEEVCYTFYSNGRRALEGESVFDLIEGRGMRRVIIESPFKATERYSERGNIEYARAAMHDCLMRGEAPYASHLLYTQRGVLDDSDPAERKHGIDAGIVWADLADAVVVYKDWESRFKILGPRPRDDE